MTDQSETTTTNNNTATQDNIRKSKKAFKTLFGVAGCIVIVAMVFMLAMHNHITTDNAQIDADVIPVSARISGPVAEVLIQDNQMVKKGDIILTIDAADYEAKLNQAKADLQVAQAQLINAQAQEKILIASAKGNYTSALAMYDNSTASESSAEAQINSAKAAVSKATAQLHSAELELNRTRSVFAAGGVSRSQLDDDQTTYDMAVASLEQAKAGLIAAQEQRRGANSLVSSAKGKLTQSSSVTEQVEAAKAQTTLAKAKVQSATATLELAQNQYNYTTVRASESGRVSKLSVHTGQLLSSGQVIAELVPSDSYVIANFKEQQIGKIAVGNKVKITVDASPNTTYNGVVESISAGTGSRFSLLPPDNASGNFVKVVQRIPVRIRWSKNSTGSHLQAGLSAKVTVYANSGGA